MNIETSLQHFVLTDTDISALLVHDNEAGTEQEHMFPVFASAKAVAPYIVYRRSATDRSRTMSGPTGHAQPTFILTCWAKSYDESIDLATKVRARLDGEKGTWSGVSIEHCNVTDETDAFNPSPELEEKQFFGRELTVEIQHEEELLAV